MRRRRGLTDERLLCSGPGPAVRGAGRDASPTTGSRSTGRRSSFTRATRKPEIAAGVRIGITKAAELPWRYGLKGSRFLSKPFKDALSVAQNATASQLARPRRAPP